MSDQRKVNTKRIFVAIDIPEDVRGRVLDHVSKLRNAFRNSAVKWEKAEKLHITLHFAGDLDNKGLDILNTNVQNIAATISSYQVILSGTGAFLRDRRGGGVLWLGLEEMPDDQGKLNELAARVSGNKIPQRFKPHLTIARVKNRLREQKLIAQHLSGDFSPEIIPIEALTIYESRLLPSGSVYSILDRHPLLKR